jgi:hypothetical protein
MSTITSPRETSVPVNGRRVPLISTPTSSSRPSLDLPRSSDASPNRSSTSTTQPPQRRNRAALREYYNLKKSSAPDPPSSPTSSTTSIHDLHYSDIPSSELDDPSFDAQAYIKHVLENQSLAQLLKTYNGVLTDIRALDAEKKALVYDNYSKLIAATETIRKMRANMDPISPMASTLDLAIVGIYERAEGIKSELRDTLPASQRKELEMGKEEREILERKRRTREVVKGVLGAPGRVRELVREGRMEDARALWEDKSRLLERWKEWGVGGADVQACIDEGDAALKGE